MTDARWSTRPAARHAFPSRNGLPPAQPNQPTQNITRGVHRHFRPVRIFWIRCLPDPSRDKFRSRSSRCPSCPTRRIGPRRSPNRTDRGAVVLGSGLPKPSESAPTESAWRLTTPSLNASVENSELNATGWRRGREGWPERTATWCAPGRRSRVRSPSGPSSRRRSSGSTPGSTTGRSRRNDSGNAWSRSANEPSSKPRPLRNLRPRGPTSVASYDSRHPPSALTPPPGVDPTSRLPPVQLAPGARDDDCTETAGTSEAPFLTSHHSHLKPSRFGLRVHDRQVGNRGIASGTAGSRRPPDLRPAMKDVLFHPLVGLDPRRESSLRRQVPSLAGTDWAPGPLR